MGRTLYLECYSGISGDMTVAALLDLGADQKVLEDVLESIPVQGFEIKVSRVTKSGIDACDFDVILDAEIDGHDHDMEYLHGHDHSHTHGQKNIITVIRMRQKNIITVIRIWQKNIITSMSIAMRQLQRMWQHMDMIMEMR